MTLNEPPQGELDHPIQVVEWELLSASFLSFTTPEHYILRLSGRVFGHPAFIDGDLVATSLIDRFWVEEDQIFARSKNGIRYELHGAPSMAYEEICPNARELLIELYAAGREWLFPRAES